MPHGTYVRTGMSRPWIRNIVTNTTSTTRRGFQVNQSSSHTDSLSKQHAYQDVVVEISGAVKRPLSLDLDALREFESMSIAPFDFVCFTTGPLSASNGQL